MTQPAETSLELLGDRVGHLVGGPYSNSALLAACGEVRGYCDWHISPVRARTVIRSGTGGQRLVLPTLALQDVTAVRFLGRTDLDQAITLTGWRPSVAGMLLRSRGWPCGVDNLAVDLVDGYDTLPDELLGVIAERARAIDAAAPVGVRGESEQRTSGRVSWQRQVTYADGGPTWSIAATAVLNRYTVMV